MFKRLLIIILIVLFSIICGLIFKNLQTEQHILKQEQSSENLNESIYVSEIEENNLKAKMLAGDADAANKLAIFYIMEESDYDKAIKVLMPFAEKGNTRSQYYLGICYKFKNNKKLAVYWLKKAADKKLKAAIDELSKI